MSFQEDQSASSSGGDNALTSCPVSGTNKLNDIVVDDSAEDPASSCEKNAFDNSSDEFHKTDTFDQAWSQKRDKKYDKQSKSKVKIKTLTIDGQLVYFCKICDKIFTRRKDKLNHELAHSGESVLACTECGKEYLHESSLASHMRTHAGDPLYMCDLCPKMFAQSHHLKTHILSHSEPTNFVCKTCYIEFPTSSDLSHHGRIQSKLEMTKYWCKMCKVYFCRGHKLTCDQRLHAFCCSACNELFYTQKKLKIHVKKFAHYSLDKPKYIEPLQQHELYPDKIQDSLKKVQTQNENDLIRKPPKNDLDGKIHIEEVAEVPLKKFKLSLRKLILDEDQSSTSVQDSAPETNKEFQIQLKSFTKHRKGKPYCKKCNKSFKDSVSLCQHKALVHEDKQDTYTCEICSMGFASKEDLDVHGFKHSEERIHTCPVCGQEFLNSVNLTKHLRIHVVDFPYKCSQCGKAFRLKIQLIQHVRLHIAQDANTSSSKLPQNFIVGKEHHDHYNEESETFKCHLCSKKFLFRYKLLNHLRLHTNVKCFQCYICHKTFATKCYLQRHLQVHVKQGMDVDVHNIIIDDDSKVELDSFGEQITKDNFQNCESIFNRHSLDGFEREDLKKSFVCIKASASSIELAAGSCSSSWNKTDHDNLNQNTIKVEVQDKIDSASEHSFCSSFTRDSERSDPFKFSSDESYTFKTTMAKERRKLKRKWRKSRGILINSDLQALAHLKRSHVNAEIVCCETGSGHEDEVMDMMLELNTVKCEQDDVTTVYVNLTHKKSPIITKTDQSCTTECKTSVKDNSILPKFDLNIKDEINEKQEVNNSEAAESNHNDIIKIHQDAGQTANCGKRFMFEFDVEQLVDNDKLFADGDIQMTSNKFADKNKVTERQKLESENQSRQTELTQNVSSSPSNPSMSSQKSPLKLIIPDSNMTSESSNLEKLQAVFEHSSKYLPLTTKTSSGHSYLSHNPTVSQDKPTSNRKENETESNKEDQSRDMNSLYKYDSQEQPQPMSVLQNPDDRQVTQKVQNIVITENKQQQETRASGSKIPHFINSGPDSRTERISNVTISENCPKFTSETVSSNKPDSNVFSQKDNNKNMNVRNSESRSSHVLLDTNSCTFSNPLLPQTFNATNVTHDPLPSSIILPPPSSLSNSLSYYPVISSSGTDFNQLQSGLNLHTSSVLSMNLNPYFNQIGVQDLNTDNTAGGSSYTSNQMNTTGPFGSCFISANPLVNPVCAVGLNTSGNQGLQLAVNQDCFSLNSSAIFDANNPVYRDMNMMDLISTPSTEGTQSMVTAHQNFMRQGNMETQMKHEITSIVDAQNAILHQHNPFINFGNPIMSANLGSFGNPTGSADLSNFGNPTTSGNFGNPTVSADLSNFGNSTVSGNYGNPTVSGNFGNPTVSGNYGNPLSLFNQGLIPMNYGHLNNPVFHVRQGGFGGGEDSLMNISNIYGPVYRDDATLGNYGVPQLSMPGGNLTGQVPMNVSGVFPLNNGNIGSLSSFRPGNFNASIPVNFADYGGSSLTSTGLQPFSQANFNCDIPLSIPTNSHVINNLMGYMGVFPTSGLQDSLGNLITSSGINLLNSSSVQQNNGTLPGSSLGFINNINTGYFPNF